MFFVALLQMNGGDSQEEALDLTLEAGYDGEEELVVSNLGPNAEVCCGICGQCMAKKALRMHALVHSGERRYSCLLCGAGFMKKGDLNRHLRTHTGEKPFQCNVCDRAFNRKYLLRNHQVMVHKREVKVEEG